METEEKEVFLYYFKNFLNWNEINLNCYINKGTVVITCDDLNNLAGSLNSLTANQLSTLTNTEFTSCQTLLGDASNAFSSDQLAVLVNTAKSINNNNVGSISDSDIASLNAILLGFSSTDLSQLVFTSITSISAIGSLTGWTSSQVKYINYIFNTLLLQNN